MTYGGRQAGPGGQAGLGAFNRWPVASDQAPHRYYGPRADPIAFLLLLIAGACGVAQYVISGFPVGQSQALGGTVVTGKQLLSDLSAHDTSTASVTRIALLVTTVGGGALLLLAITTLLPINHTPLGAVSLVISLAVVASSVWFLAQAARVLGSPASALWSTDHLGWYLTAAAALVGVVGSFKALGG